MLRLLGGHLRDEKVGYFQHLGRAWWLAAQSGIATLMLVVHGIFPFVWVRSASSLIRRLYLETLGDFEE